MDVVWNSLGDINNKLITSDPDVLKVKEKIRAVHAAIYSAWNDADGKLRALEEKYDINLEKIKQLIGKGKIEVLADKPEPVKATASVESGSIVLTDPGIIVPTISNIDALISSFEARAAMRKGGVGGALASARTGISLAEKAEQERKGSGGTERG